jgi:ribosomal protein S18 acetylase RimI-like enzyme
MALVSELHVSDIPLVKSFILRAWRLAGSSALGWAGATEENITEIASESFLQGLIGDPNLKVFISKIGEEVVGFCAIRKMDSKLLELAGIIVREDQTGKGIGNNLLEMAKKEAVKLGFTTMSVKTEAINKRALSFYIRKGFVEQEQVVEKLNGIEVNLAVLKLDLRKTYVK